MRPSCGGRPAKLLSARSSSASLRLHAASGRLDSLHAAHCSRGVSRPTLSHDSCSLSLMSSASEQAQHPTLEKESHVT